MSIFTDDFNRADGALGGNWATMYGAPLIASGWVKNNTAGAAEAIDTTISDQDYQRCSVRLSLYGGTNPGGPIIKATSSSSARYAAGVVLSSGTYYLRIYTGNPGVMTQLASKALASAPPSIYTLSLEYDLGTLTATIPDFDTLTVEDSTYANGLYMGIRAVTTVVLIDSVTMVTGNATGLAIEPEVIGNYGECTEVTLTGTNTDWTDGTPGAPIFTVNHGTISAQTISGNVATLTYCPGSYLGTITFTDPSTGDTVGALVTSDPGIVDPAGGCAFNDAFVEMANDTGTYYTPSRLMTIDTTIDLVPPMTIPYALSLIYQYMRAIVGDVDFDDPDLVSTDILHQLINGGYPPPVGPWPEPPSTPIAQNVGDLLTAMATLITVNDYTLGDVIVQLAGEGVPTHKDIMDAVAALDAPDLQPVLDAIAAARGDPVANIREVVTQLDALRTINDWTLGNVKTWIEAIEGGEVDLQPVLDAIAALSTKVDAVEDHIRDDIAALGLVVVAVQTTVGTVSTAVGGLVTSVASVLELLGALHNTPAVPLWPGGDDATLGTEVALVDQLELTTPMHGVLVDVTTPPTRTGRREIGGHLMDYGVGEISFVNDAGYIEPWQYMGFRTAIFTPRTMEVAAGAVFRVLAGAGGTVTPWTRT